LIASIGIVVSSFGWLVRPRRTKTEN
jgi:hypothetical protein